MKILAVTNLFPNVNEPDRGIFNAQQFKELSSHSSLRVVAPVPYFKYSKRKLPIKDKVGDISVYYPRYLVIPKVLRSLYGIFFYWGIKNYIKQIQKDFSFDAILATWAYPDAFGAALVARVLNKPLFVKVHGSDINILTQHPFRCHMIRFALKQSEKIIAVSEDLKDKVIGLGISHEKIEVLRNGIDTNIFQPMDQQTCRKKLSLPENKKIVLYVGHLEKVKGVDVLINAASQSPKDIHFIFLGNGRLKKALQTTVQERNLQKHVSFYDAVAHNKIPIWMNAADVLCLPSRQEGCPNVILEALACQTKILATKTGGIPELVRSRNQGQLVAPENVVALAEGIKNIFVDQIGPETPKPYSWQQNGKDLFSILSEPLKTKHCLYHHRTQGRGAEGVHIREIINGLRTLEHRVTLVSPPGIDPFLTDHDRQMQTKSQPFLLKKIAKKAPQFLFECLELFYNIWARQKLRKTIKTGRVDFIYERYAFFCSAGVKVAKRFGIPIILEINEISGIKRERGQTFTKLCSHIEKKIFLQADQLIVVSQFLKDELIKRGVDENKISVIPNAVNLEDFNPQMTSPIVRQKYGLEEKIIVTFVGTFSKWDQLDGLIKSFGKAYQENKNSHLMLVGDGSQRKSLENQIKDNQLEGAVTLTGFIDRKKIPEYISATDVCVLFGSNPFGSPIVLFEYMAMQKPVIAPDYGPISSVVDHNKDGLLFNPEDSEAFSSILEQLIKDHELRRRLGKNAREKIELRHTWLKNAHRVLKIFEEIKQ